jgi:DNA polymerase
LWPREKRWILLVTHRHYDTAANYLPERLTMTNLRQAAKDCQGCDLFERATQVVFGAGPARSDLMIVGEVPGEQEDQAGLPFVGPAGKLLDEALANAGIERRQVYVTNAVKHFKWVPRGRRRLHARPSSRQISACRAWLDAEIQVVRPRLILCLGAVAGQSILGREFRITAHRGEVWEAPALEATVIATWHPSAVLRAPLESERQRMRDELFDDVRKADSLRQTH